MTTAKFALPAGWTYSDLREFLESELQEDFGGNERYSLWLRDFDDASVIYSGTDGALYRRPYTLDNGDVQWGQPSEVMAKTSYQPVADVAAFSVGAAVDDGDYVLRRGKVFEVGNYPDKAFSLSVDEARAAVAAFRPVANDIEHRPSILDNKLGELRAVEMGADGTSIIGTTAIPRWLHESIGDAPLKVSLAWDRERKQIVKNGLVIAPRVPDAALMSAYAEFAGKRHSAGDQQQVQAIHDHALALGAESPGKQTGTTPKKGTVQMTDEQPKRTFAEKFAAWFNGTDLTDAERDAADARFAAETPVTVREVTPKADPEKAAMAAKLAAQEAQIAALRERDIERDAAAFADTEIAEKRAMPAERANLIAEFTQAAHDDLTAPATVTFSTADGAQEGSRVDAVRARHAGRIAHRLTEEMVRDLADDEHAVLFSALTTRKSGTEGAPSAERIAELKAASPLGRAVLDTK